MASLVERARHGDQAAWNSLVDRFAPLVWSVGRSFSLSSADAQDAFQAVWLQLVEHLGSLRDPDRLPGWLATTTRRECMRVLRAGRRELVGDLVVGAAAESTVAALDNEVVERDHVAGVVRTMAELPLRQRATLALLYDGFDVEEIANLLALSPSTVRTHIQRARERMRNSASTGSGPHSGWLPRPRRSDHDDLHGGTSGAGLPVRVPMAQLPRDPLAPRAPGGSSDESDPAEVKAALRRFYRAMHRANPDDALA